MLRRQSRSSGFVFIRIPILVKVYTFFSNLKVVTCKLYTSNFLKWKLVDSQMYSFATVF
jgi:hypothetical protein